MGTIDLSSGDHLADSSFPTLLQLILSLAKGAVLQSVRVRAGFPVGLGLGPWEKGASATACWVLEGGGWWSQCCPCLQVAFQCNIPSELFLRLFPTAAFEAPQTELEVNKEAFVQVPPPSQGPGWGGCPAIPGPVTLTVSPLSLAPTMAGVHAVGGPPG